MDIFNPYKFDKFVSDELLKAIIKLYRCLMI